ncbi:MAG: DUF2938 domain-containing protein [Pseudomonadales bacterium]
MSDLMMTFAIGVGATAVMDVWSLARRAVFRVPAPDYRLVGRWVGHLVTGQFLHESIAASPPVRREAAIGWTAHYLIGVGFAGLLVAIAGADWCREPTLAPALAVGVVTVLAPFLIMQPGMGSGIAASRTPDPNAARLQSLITHTVFGFGLYLSAWVIGRIAL